MMKLVHADCDIFETGYVRTKTTTIDSKLFGNVKMNDTFCMISFDVFQCLCFRVKKATNNFFCV